MPREKRRDKGPSSRARRCKAGEAARPRASAWRGHCHVLCQAVSGAPQLHRPLVSYPASAALFAVHRVPRRTPLTMKGPTLSFLARRTAQSLKCSRVIRSPGCPGKALQSSRAAFRSRWRCQAERRARLIIPGACWVTHHLRPRSSTNSHGEGHLHPMRKAESHAKARGPLALRHDADSQGQTAAQALESWTGSRLPRPPARS